MEKRHISAHEVLQDMHAGLDDNALMQKYHLSAKDFKELCKKLVDTGRLTDLELSELELLWAQSEGRVWHCPACHMPQSHEFDECPQCGIIVAKYQQKHPQGTQSPQQELFVEVPPEDPAEEIAVVTTGKSAPEKQGPVSQCPACDTLLLADAKFCPFCGTRVRN